MKRTTAALAVLALSVFALGLRARGIDFSLPHATHADARVLVDQVAALRAGEPDPEGHRLYPHLVPRIASLFAEPGERDALPNASAAEHRARASGPWLRARWTSVWLSIPLIGLTYLLARAALGRGASLFASALVATSLLQLSFAQQERPHAALATTSALAVVAALRLRRRPQWMAYALAGLAAALAVGSLHSGLAVLPAGLAAHLLRRRDRGAPGTAVPRLSLGEQLPLVAPIVAVIAAIGVFYPFHFRPPSADGTAETLQVEAQGEEQVLNLSGHYVKLEAFDGSGFGEVAGALYSYDPVLAALTLLGLLSLLVRRPRAERGPEQRRDVLVLAAYALPYLLAIGLYAKTPERFVMPLTPYAAILAARGASLIAPRNQLAWLGAALLLAFPAGMCWYLGGLRGADDTYARAADWVASQVPDSDRVALLLDPHQDLPLIQNPEAAAANAAWPWPSRWSEYLSAQPALPAGRDLRVVDVPGRRPADLERNPLGVLRELGAQYAVVERVAGGPKSRSQRAVRDGLFEAAELVHRVSPLRLDSGGSERLFIRSVSWKRPMFLRILKAHCIGPSIEVFRVPGRGEAPSQAPGEVPGKDQAKD